MAKKRKGSRRAPRKTSRKSSAKRSRKAARPARRAAARPALAPGAVDFRGVNKQLQARIAKLEASLPPAEARDLAAEQTLDRLRKLQAEMKAVCAPTMILTP